ncbi:MAG: DUF2254 domain-containing protein [Anaerolineales bacterium]
MNNRIRFFLTRMRERLWVKPLLISLLSVVASFLAKLTDQILFLQLLPEITPESLETLLGIIGASMLGISVFAVGSMVSAYSSASNTATPRSFSLVIADDVSQNALSTFIGAFIFSIVSLIALMNGFYGTTGRFLLFLITIAVFSIVIINFLRWIDRIARLGRLGTTIDKVEKATHDAMQKKKLSPSLKSITKPEHAGGSPVYSPAIGYVQQINIQKLQAAAENFDLQITVHSLPGTFLSPNQPLAMVTYPKDTPEEETDLEMIINAFTIGKDRTFDDDPRFGLLVLSEIASRALSPAVNDPGTAVDIIDTLVRLFTNFSRTEEDQQKEEAAFDRVVVPDISLDNMFDDAFNAIARDGAGNIKIALRLQKAFKSLSSLSNKTMAKLSRDHARLAFRYAEKALSLPEEIHILREKSIIKNDT